MKVFLWLWLVFFLLLSCFDATLLWAARGQLAQSLELSLDAALVGALSEEALSMGIWQMDRQQAHAIVEEQLHANSALMLRDGLSVDLIIDQNGDQGTIQGIATASIPLIMTRYLGMEGFEIKVRKQMQYQGIYK